MTDKGSKTIKVILVVYGLLFIIIWGLIPIFGVNTLASLLGLNFSERATLSREAGWMGMIIGLLILFASRDPVKNILVINIMILGNILFIIFYFVELLIIKEAVEFIWWLNLIPGIIFLVLLIIFRPKKA